MWLRWLPWRFVVRHVAHSYGFLDPMMVLARLHRFAQPAEVIAPTELLRSGAVLHARGLMNSQAIQHNLDWVWPYWVTRQFDPRDQAFVPRAFSLTHINLTHRNWTAVGLPGDDRYVLVDPRGLVTPFFDGWSVDCWVIAADGRRLYPSQRRDAAQTLHLDGRLAVETRTSGRGLELAVAAEVLPMRGEAVCRLTVTGAADADASLVVSLRPYNPEGVSFLHQIDPLPRRDGWRINRRALLHFHDRPPERMTASTYSGGDVATRIADDSDGKANCNVGLATAAAFFALRPGAPRRVIADIPLGPQQDGPRPRLRARRAPALARWSGAAAGHAALEIPNAQWRFLYEAAVRTLVLHAPDTGEVYPGPYTYRRFWFRDAAFILSALLAAGMPERVARALARFPDRQTALGYFRSQHGEWDSNGQVLWIIERYHRATGLPLDPRWRSPIRDAARWIKRKRLADGLTAPHAGLMPAGFSAEHLGPNDYYYWDDFWSVGGLRAAAWLLERLDEPAAATASRQEQSALEQAIERSLVRVAARLGHQALPASPYRRMDAGAIGSIAGGYPLRLWAPEDPRLLATTAFLLDTCFIDGAFYQEISHSGLNAYLTLHVAQVLLRAGDARWLEIVQHVADLASPTGQWPEAVHPQTKGGCMGDGQHVWASAEWVLMMRSCFIREEGDRLVLGSGIPPAWREAGKPMRFGETLTDFGPVTVTITPQPGGAAVSWEARWHHPPRALEIRVPGCAPATATPDQTSVTIAHLAAPLAGPSEPPAAPA